MLKWRENVARDKQEMILNEGISGRPKFEYTELYLS